MKKANSKLNKAPKDKAKGVPPYKPAVGSKVSKKLNNGRRSS